MRRSNLRPVFQMSSSFNDSPRFLYGSPHSQNFYAEFQRFPQRILSPVTVIMLLCICKGIRCVQNLSKSCSALFGAGRKGSTFHFYRCAAFGFPVRHHIPCFSEKAVCRPCDALTEGKTQRTEGLFYGLHRPAPLPRPVLHTGRQEDSDRMCPHPAALWSG